MDGLARRQGDVFLFVLPGSYFRLYPESRRFSWNTFLRLYGRISTMHTAADAVAAADSVGWSASAKEKSVAGRRFLPPAVVGPRKSQGRIATGKRNVISRDSLLSSHIFGFSRRAWRIFDVHGVCMIREM